MSQLFTLDLPNKEIKVGLFECLLPNYLDGMYAEEGDVTIAHENGNLHSDKMGVRYMNNDEIAKYGPIIKALNPKAKFRP